MTAYYNNEPAAITYMPLPDGMADVWLRRDISQTTDDDGAAMWSAEEFYMRTSLSKAEVEAQFDELYDSLVEAEQSPPVQEETVLQRLATVEEAIELILSGVTE